MVQQFTFADSKFNGKRRKTRKETFLARMDALLPWARMLSVIEPVYPKADNGSRPIHSTPCCEFTTCSSGITICDGAMEYELYEITSLCGRWAYR